MVPPAGVEPTLANYLLHTGYKSAVLPLNYRGKNVVGVQGFEPWTPWSQTRCATRLRYTPNKNNRIGFCLILNFKLDKANKFVRVPPDHDAGISREGLLYLF